MEVEYKYHIAEFRNFKQVERKREREREGEREREIGKIKEGHLQHLQ